MKSNSKWRISMLLAACCWLWLFSPAQNENFLNPQDVFNQHNCGFEEIKDKFYVKGSDKTIAELQEDYFSLALQTGGGGQNGVVDCKDHYRIPVVWYVIHDGSNGFVSEQRILANMTVLNNAYAGTGIEFCLATQFNGNPIPVPPNTNGVLNTYQSGSNPGLIWIEHPYLAATYQGGTSPQHAQMTGLSVLPEDRYLRIFVIPDAHNGVGWTYLPGSAPTGEDGIFMSANVIGDPASCLGICPPGREEGDVLLHEAGHYLNLLHVFDGGCSGGGANCLSGGDLVCDTPPTLGNSGQACLGFVDSCPGDGPDILDNYMDYVDDFCMASFTQGQFFRQRQAACVHRSLMVSDANQLYTGTLCPDQNWVCDLNPDFQFMINANDCEVSFMDTSTPGGSSMIGIYLWDFGDGNTSVDPNPTHIYSQAGTYTVCLLVSGLDTATGEYCECSITYDVVVPCSNPTCFVNACATHTWLSGTTYQFDASCTTGNGTLSYVWLIEGTNYYVVNPQHTFTTTGYQFYQVTVTNTLNGQTCTDTWYGALTPPPPCSPQANFTWSQTVDCVIDFQSTSIPGPPYQIISFDWDWGDLTPHGNQSSESHTYLNPGTYTVCLTISVSDGQVTCTDTFCDQITVSCVSDPCYLEPDFTWNDLGNCQIEFIDLTTLVNATSIQSWDWDFGDGTTDVGPNPVHVFPGSGVYLVCLTVTGKTINGDSCPFTICHFVEVNCGNNCVPDPNFIINDLGMCCYEFIDLTPDPTGDPGCQFWEIFDSQGNSVISSPGDSFVHCFTVDDTYTICRTDCCQNVDGTTALGQICQTLVVNCSGCSPNASFSWTDNGDCCLEFVANFPDPNTDFCSEWNIFDANGLLINAAGQQLLYCFPASGTYQVCYETCCIDADGNVIVAQECVLVDVACSCVPNPAFAIVDLGDCCYEFIPENALDGCDEFVINDSGGNPIGSVVGPPFIWCFQTSGNFQVCYTDCCFNPDGTVNQLTACQDLTVNCDGCVPNPSFAVVDIGDCCYEITPENAFDSCDEFIIYDSAGNAIGANPGTAFIFCFQTSGTYTICYTDCCENPDGTISSATSCVDIDVNCGGCIPNPSFAIVDLGDCCYEITPENAMDLCDEFIIYDSAGNAIGSNPGTPFVFCFPISGNYTICYTDCCINPDGSISSATACQNIDVDCGGCVPDPNFGWTDLGDCCYEFFDLTPDPNSEPSCQNWDIIDASGAIIGSAGGGNLIFCFPASGIYQICYTDCCVNPDGTVTESTLCQQIEVDCGCDVIPDILIEENGCVHTYTVNNLGSTPGDQVCVDIPGIGTVPLASATWTVDHTGFCGGYGLCITMFCCGDDPATGVTICFDQIIDCCCEPDPIFGIDLLDDCCYLFTDLTPLLNTEPGCQTWTITNVATGLEVGTGNGDQFTFCFPETGTYEICHVDCCIDSAGNVTISDPYCVVLDVICPCTPPADLTIDAVSGDGCNWGFCVLGDFDITEHCATWDFGDGTVVNTPLDICPVHQYECDGVYDVCVTVYCCDDPTIATAVCTTITVDCPCKLPSSVNIDTVIDGCTVTAGAVYTDDYCGPLCFAWDFGDGSPAVFSETATYTYPADGTYPVCLTVFCCDDPNIAITVCVEVTVDCPCEAPTNLSIDAVSGDGCNWGFCVLGDFDVTEHCATWDFGDGTVVNTPLDICPVHQYECDGVYDVCVTVYCCDDPTIATTVCTTITVDCPCKLPTSVFIDTVVDGCTVTAGAVYTDDYCGPLCFAWDFGDGSPAVFSETATYTYPADGTYPVCLTVFCCDDPNIAITVCVEVTVDCPCEAPTNLSIDAVSGDGCNWGFCVLGDFDVTEHCATWDFGDGTVVNTPLDICPVHQYECDGVYDVCVTVYCCDDPTIATTVCTTITVDCPCNLADVDFNVTIDACTACFEPTSCGSAVGSDYCYDFHFDWFNDPFIGTGDLNPCYTYSAPGTYHVCMHIWCCDDPNNIILVCKDIVIEDLCEPCSLPSGYGFNWTADGCTVYVSSFYTDDYMGDICFEWDFGDGTPPVSGEFAQHTYTSTGTYSVCLRIFCCDDPSIFVEFCDEVFVECDCPQPCEIHPAFIYDILLINVSDGCCVQFTDLSSAGSFTTITNWSWDFGDGATSNLPSPAHCYSNPGTYTVCLTITGSSPDGVCTETFCWELFCDCEDTCPSDLNGDGIVNISDLLIFLGSFNQTCP